MSDALFAIVNALEGVFKTLGGGFNNIVEFIANGADGVISALSS